MPNGIFHAGDGRLFITERTGQIKIILPGGEVVGEPFLDLRKKVGSLEDSNQGLLGMAFHPAYAQNGFFYLNYTDLKGDTVISRFQVSESNPNLANPASETLILAVDQPAPHHNGGTLTFGPDGYLYIGLGDGENPGDPNENAQNLESLLGKILRLDVDNGLPYAIPPGNPFADDGDPATRAEIWAYGIRNPWRFSFDRMTGDLWMGDVGQDAWEEINFEPVSSLGGENYGWDCYEGVHPFELEGCGAEGDFTFPVYEYAHSGSCSAVVGGYVYRGSYAALHGVYFFADVCQGKIWGLAKNSKGQFTVQIWTVLEEYVFSFGEDLAGQLYLASYDGVIYQFQFESLIYLPLVTKP